MAVGSILSNFSEFPTGARPAGGLGSAAGSAGALYSAKDSIGAAATDSFESRLRSAMTAQDESELKDACTQFEELMLGIVYKQMKATIQRSSLTNEDPGRETYEQWQDEQMMKELAKNGSFGLADMMFKQLSLRMKNAYTLDEDT